MRHLYDMLHLHDQSWTSHIFGHACERYCSNKMPSAQLYKSVNDAINAKMATKCPSTLHNRTCDRSS